MIMRLIAALAIFCLCATAHAVMFRRDILTIVPTNKIILNEQGQPLKEQPKPRESFQFYTEIRDEQALRLDWVHSLNRINAQRTMMILFNPPRYDMLMAQNVYQPLDIISISPEGVITQIIPEVILAQLAAPIESRQPAHARLVVDGGAAALLELKIGDRVQHPSFKAAPTVMTE